MVDSNELKQFRRSDNETRKTDGIFQPFFYNFMALDIFFEVEAIGKWLGHEGISIGEIRT